MKNQDFGVFSLFLVFIISNFFTGSMEVQDADVDYTYFGIKEKITPFRYDQMEIEWDIDHRIVKLNLRLRGENNPKQKQTD